LNRALNQKEKSLNFLSVNRSMHLLLAIQKGDINDMIKSKIYYTWDSWFVELFVLSRVHANKSAHFFCSRKHLPQFLRLYFYVPWKHCRKIFPSNPVVAIWLEPELKRVGKSESLFAIPKSNFQVRCKVFRRPEHLCALNVIKIYTKSI